MKKFNFSHLCKLAGMALLAFGLSGCPTTYNMGTARTIGEGEMEFNTTLVYQGLDVGALVGDSSVGSVAIPFVDFGYRYGVAENMDLGINVKGIGKVGADLKINLVDTDSIALSIAPEISGSQIAGAGVLQWDLPILLDLILSEDLSIVIAMKYTGYMPIGSDDAFLSNFVGGTIGLDFALGESFAIHPFAGVAYLIAEELPDNVEVILPHAGLGLRFGL